jgi:ketosteroid isomerase-like protein
MTTANEALIRKFYTSFQQLDAAGMKACYHEDVLFSDPAFPMLKGKEAGAMWSMLIDALNKNKNDWKLEFNNISVTKGEGSCQWEAHYLFSLTGNKVHNRIDAHFTFLDNKIIHHVDMFDFYRWARMAFGLTGTLIGWTPYFQKKVQQKTREQLKKYMTRNVI